VVNVFARSLTDDLASLVKEIDSYVSQNQPKQASAFLVLLSNDPDADEPKLKDFAKKHGIKGVPLTLFDGESGPPSYKVAKEAEVTVLLWKGQSVKANHAFAKDGLKADAIKKVVADTSKILD
jgi:hypothetical protein